MNYKLENRVSMYYKIREFFANNLTTLSATASGLTAVVNNFLVALLALDDLIMLADETNTGYAVQKQVNRTTMRDLALSVSGALYAHAVATGNNPLAAKAYTVKSTLDKKRDTDILYWCQRLFTLASANAAALIPLGITGSVLTNFNASISAFSDSIQEPADKRSEGKAALLEAEKQSDTVDKELKMTDGIMLAISNQHSLLYNQYKADRLIDDNAAGVGSPDVIEIIEAGNIESIYNVPYNPSRSFTIKNNGTVDLLWGLSDSETSATNPLQTLAAGASSTKLSSTLAANGDFVLLQNVNATDAEVELTIIE